jgi:hypothetical protein
VSYFILGLMTPGEGLTKSSDFECLEEAFGNSG